MDESSLLRAKLRAQVHTDLRAFQADYRGGDPVPTVVVRMSAKLVAMPQRKIVLGITSEKKVKASGSKFEDVLNAFDDAVGHVFREIVVAVLTAPVEPTAG